MSAFNALVLNADFRPVSVFPLSTMPWQDTIRAVVRGTVSVIEEYAEVVRSPSTVMKIPSVIALRQYQKIDRHVAFTRLNVFMRDDFTCQYCDTVRSSSDLTFEHVIPRSKGGKTTWSNICAACLACNALKADRLDMKPIRMPRKPDPWQLLVKAGKRNKDRFHVSWLDYLYWDSELQP